jgi:hypothetical protein
MRSDRTVGESNAGAVVNSLPRRARGHYGTHAEVVADPALVWSVDAPCLVGENERVQRHTRRAWDRTLCGDRGACREDRACSQEDG